MIKLLTIGNSFADNAAKYLEQIAASDGTEILVGKANIGGCPISKHWNLVEQCAALPWVKPYSFYLTGSENVPMSLADALAAEKWDFVTMQQVSDQSWRSETFYPYINKLSDFVAERAPGAERLIHQTWAYRVDAHEYAKYGIDQQTMYASLREAYKGAAEATGGLRILPCGDAFQKARAVCGYKPDPNYDFANPPLMKLPDQTGSIIAGYHWATGATSDGKAQLVLDGRHGNAIGCMLAGLVWYRALSGRKLDGVTFMPDGVTEGDMRIIKEAAEEAVSEIGRW